MLAIVSFEVVGLRFTLRLPASRLRLWLWLSRFALRLPAFASGFPLAACGAVGGKSKTPRHRPKPGESQLTTKKNGRAPKKGAIEKLFGSHLADGIVAGANLDEAGFFALLEIRLQGRAHG